MQDPKSSLKAVRFRIVAAALLVPLCFVICGIVDYAEGNLTIGRAERLGVAYVAPLNALLQAITKSPGSAASRELDELERLTTSQGDPLQVATTIAAWRTQPPTEPQVLALFAQVSNKSQLAFDPELDSYYTIALVMEHAPKLAGTAAQLKLKRTRTLHDAVVKAVNRAIAANPELANDLSLTALEEAYLQFQDAVDAPRSSPEAIAAAKQAGLDLGSSTLAVAAKSAQALDRLLAKRVDGLESRRNQLLGLTLLVLVLALAAAFSAARRWVDSQVRTSVPPVAKKPAPEVLWPMATVRARAFVAHRAALRKTQ